MSVMSNKKRNKKKKRLKKLLVMVLILFLMLGFAGIWLVHQKNESEKQQRKAEAIAALESVPTVTPTPAAGRLPWNLVQHKWQSHHNDQ